MVIFLIPPSRLIRYDFYLLQLGFHPVTVAFTLVLKRQKTVIYIRRNNTDHRTHEIGSKTYKTKIKHIITT